MEEVIQVVLYKLSRVLGTSDEGLFESLCTFQGQTEEPS